MRQLMEVSKSYLVIVPTPVMYELAFGVPGTASSNEEKLWAEINSHGRSHEMQHFNWLQLRNQVPKNGLMLINPGFNEWWTARTRILKYVEVAKAQPGKSKRNDSFDALIHAMARNLFVPVCTDNVKDFEKFNRAGTLINRDGVVPLFTPEQVVESLTGTVKYVPLHSS